MSGLFTRNVAVLNIDGEHLVYRRDRSLGENNDEIIFQNGVRAQQPVENQQPNNDAGNCLSNLNLFSLFLFNFNFNLKLWYICVL